MKKLLTVLLAGVFATSAFAADASGAASQGMKPSTDMHSTASSSKKHSKKKAHHHHHKSNKKSASAQAGM